MTSTGWSVWYPGRRCPQCSEPLFRRRFGALELDGCRGCGGVFFDSGELATAAREHPDALAEADRFFRAGLQPALSPERSDACSGCTQPMTEGEHPSYPGIAMRLCRACGGVFLPEGSGLALGAKLSGESPAEVGAPTPDAPTDAPENEVADRTSTKDLPLVRGALIARDVDHSSGFVESLSRAVTFMGAAFRLGRDQPRLLTPIGLGIALNAIVVGVGIAIFLSLVPLGGGPEAERAFSEHGLLLTVVIASLAFVGQVVSWAAMGMTVSAVDAYMKGLAIDMSVAARDVAKNLGGIILLAIISMIVETITGSLRRRNRGLFGVFTNMASAAVNAAWTTLSFLLLPVIMIEDVGLFTALSRVREIHRRNLMTIAASEIGIRVVTGIGGLLVVGAVAGLFALVRPESALAWVLVIGLGAAVMLAVHAASVFLRATYYTCLYLWAAAVEASPDARQLRAPGPLAAAFS